MIFYFKNKNSYLYPSNEQYEDELIRYTYEKHYLYSDKDSIMPSLEYITSRHIPQASCVVPIEDLCVNYNKEEDINKDFCDDNNIAYFRLNRQGGAIVLFPGNIAVDVIYTGTDKKLPYFFREDFITFLHNCNLNVKLDNNDIMVDDKKVAGLVYTEILNKYSYVGMAVSINADIDLINKICTKPMHKIPGALSNYGITTEQIMNWELNWLNEHSLIK